MACRRTTLRLRGDSKFAPGHGLNTQGAGELYFHAFLTSGLEGGERSASRPSLFTLRERVPVKLERPIKFLNELQRDLPGRRRTCPQKYIARCYLFVRNRIFKLHLHIGKLNADTEMYIYFFKYYTSQQQSMFRSSGSYHKYILSSYICLYIILFTVGTSVAVLHNAFFISFHVVVSRVNVIAVLLLLLL